MAALEYQDRAALQEISNRLGIPAQWVDRLIQFESAWNPAAKNPYSSARGLIQIIDTSAQEIGFKNSLDAITKNPTIEQQLKNIVYPYLSKKRPIKSKQELYMAVFYPAAKSWPLDKEFPANVQAVNPGIKTVRDYMRRVDPDYMAFGIPLAILALAFLFYKSKIFQLTKGEKRNGQET